MGISKQDLLEQMDNIPRMERAIIKTLIEDALDDGCAVKHNDGEDDTVMIYYDPTDGVAKETLVDIVMRELHTTDEQYLIFYKGESKIGWVHLVYGNDGYDVIADHTDSDEMERLVAGAMELAEKFG